MTSRKQKEGIKIQLTQNGLEEFPWDIVAFANFLILLMIGLGTFACYLFHPWAAPIYLIWSLVMCFVVLRKMVCPNCYYYGKRCDFGWGLISGRFFQKGDIDEFNKALPIVLTTYSIMMFLPLVLLLYAYFNTTDPARTFPMLLVLVTLIIVIGFFMGPVRKLGCFKCKMRLYCKGSMSKKDK